MKGSRLVGLDSKSSNTTTTTTTRRGRFIDNNVNMWMGSHVRGHQDAETSALLSGGDSSVPRDR
jgi:hypothetical protein